MILSHIARLRRILRKAKASAAHRRLDRALADAGFPLRSVKDHLDCRAVGKVREQRKKVTTEALKKLVGA